MFQLIVAVVGIALVVILAIIAIWVGGSAFTSSGEKALFTTYFNQGTQIEGALKLYAANNGGIALSAPGTPGTIEATNAALEILKSNEYLTHAPDKGEWIIQGTSIYRELDRDTEGQCQRLNEFVGKNISVLPAEYEGCPPCGDEAYSDWPGCTLDSAQTP